MRNYLNKLSPALASALLVAAGVTVVRAQSGPCSVGLPRVAATAAAAGTTVVPIALVTQDGCTWTVTTDSPRAATLDVASGAGPATVNVRLAANADPAPRAITVTFNAESATPLPFLITQLGTACTFTMASPPPLGASAGGSGSFRISTQPNCSWAVSADASFVTFTPASGLADASGSATIGYSLDPNAVNPATGGIDTRITWVTITDVTAVNQTWTQITQAGESPSTPDPWNVGDVFAGIGSWWSDFGTYRILNPDGTVKALPDLHDASGMTTTACMVDPTVPNGDLFTTSWDGLKISRFSGTTHQLVGALDLSPAGLATMQRKTGTVPVPYMQNLMGGFLGQDIAYSEQVVFDQSGDFYVGGSMYASGSEGLGHAYLMKFARNDAGDIAGCPAASPCLLDWWRVDAGAETPSGPVAAGANAQWTAVYKDAFSAAPGDDAAKTAAALAAVAPLAAELSPLTAFGTAGVDELDLSSDQKTVFYTSEDGHIRRFDTAAGRQLAPLTVTNPDSQLPYGGKAYGFRLLPDGSGQADGSAGMIVAMSNGIFRLGSDGVILKPGGANAISYPVVPGVSHPFAMNLTPDAQSFWVATTQEDSSNPTATGGKIYRFHIPTLTRYGPFNVGTDGADVDIQGMCVKREYTAGVNQCFRTDENGKGVLDANGNPVSIPCRNPVVCRSLGIDETGTPNAACYPPGEIPLSVADRSSFEGDKPGIGGTTDLDLLPLTVGHRLADVVGLPPGLSKVIDPVRGDVIGLTGTVSYNTCPKELERYDLESTPETVCRSYTVGVIASDGASTRFNWDIHYRNGPPSISSHDVTVMALHDLSAPTPASDPDGDDGLIVRATAAAVDPVTGAFIANVNPLDYGLRLSSNRLYPRDAPALQVIGTPRGYPLAAPNYPTVFSVTIDLYDCNNALADGFTPSTDLDGICFHHATTTFKLTVVNQLPRFISGFDGTGAPIYVNAGVDQFSNTGISLASAGTEYTLRADAADAHLPVTFTFSCASADGSPNPAACGPGGLPAGLTYTYPGAFGNAPDPATPATNQSVTIGGTPTVPANNLLITVTLSDRAGQRNAAPFTFHWTVHGGVELDVSDQISPVSEPVSYQIAGTSPNGYHLNYSISGLPSWLSSSQANDVLTLSGTTPASAPATPPVITITITDQPPAGTVPAQTTTASFRWIVHEQPRLSVSNQQSGVNRPVTYTLTPPPGSPNGYPVTVTATTLPAWLSFDPATLTFTGTTPAGGGSFPVAVSVSDHPPAGQPSLASTATFTWAVIANRAPVCSAATVSPGLIWPPNHKLVPITIANVIDPDGDPVTVVITAITQDQPIDGLGDGHTTPFDAAGVGTSSGAVRAERTGLLRVPDDGRLYQVHFTATDAAGASCAGSVFLGVPHDQGQHDLPSDNVCRWDSTTGALLTPCAWLHAPALSLAARSNSEGDAVSVSFVATDPDDTPLTYTVSGLPPGLSMSAAGVVTGTVAAGATGGKASRKYTVTVTVNDGYGAGTASFAWTIRRR